MSSKLHTKRVFPYDVGSLRLPGSRAWSNPENAMQPGEPYAFRTYPVGAGLYSYQAFFFRLNIPTYADVVEVRWLTRARLESNLAESAYVSLYSGLGIDEEGEVVSIGRLDTSSHFGSDWSTTSTVSTFGNYRLLNFFNDNRHSRNLFSLEARASLLAGTPTTEEQTIFIDWLAIEIDYSLPEFPLEMELRIEE